MTLDFEGKMMISCNTLRTDVPGLNIGINVLLYSAAPTSAQIRTASSGISSNARHNGFG